MNQNNDLKKLSKTININFINLDILSEALTHRSYINEVKSAGNKHNERLEFLGDAVLELIVTEYLFNKYPKNNEGELTSFRAALVRTESLAAEALKLKLGEYLFMSKGEESTGGRNRPYILANAFEALIGAIYTEKGYKVAAKFIIERVCYKVEKIIKNRLDIDAKSRLQEISQEMVKVTPAYVQIKADGPDHDRVFEMGVYIGEHLFGKGLGKSKQEGEQLAAKEAIKNWDKLYKKHFSA